MSLDRQSMLTTAYEYWQQGGSLEAGMEAGKLIFESLSNECRPKWAANILRAAVVRSGIKSQPIERVLAVADHPNEWGKAHDAFDSVRRASLTIVHSEFRGSQKSLLLCLDLAELVAQVTYNATNPPDEFDEDSGWYIVGHVRKIINLINDENFSRAMWSTICSDGL